MSTAGSDLDLEGLCDTASSADTGARPLVNGHEATDRSINKWVQVLMHGSGEDEVRRAARAAVEAICRAARTSIDADGDASTDRITPTSSSLQQSAAVVAGEGVQALMEEFHAFLEGTLTGGEGPLDGDHLKGSKDGTASIAAPEGGIEAAGDSSPRPGISPVELSPSELSQLIVSHEALRTRVLAIALVSSDPNSPERQQYTSVLSSAVASLESRSQGRYGGGNGADAPHRPPRRPASLRTSKARVDPLAQGADRGGARDAISGGVAPDDVAVRLGSVAKGGVSTTTSTTRPSCTAPLQCDATVVSAVQGYLRALRAHLTAVSAVSPLASSPASSDGPGTIGAPGRGRTGRSGGVALVRSLAMDSHSHSGAEGDVAVAVHGAANDDAARTAADASRSNGRLSPIEDLSPQVSSRISEESSNLDSSSDTAEIASAMAVAVAGRGGGAPTSLQGSTEASDGAASPPAVRQTMGGRKGTHRRTESREYLVKR